VRPYQQSNLKHQQLETCPRVARTRPLINPSACQKILNTIIANKIQQHIKKSYIIINSDLFLGRQDGTKYANEKM
jgi:hypothetical protein